MTNERETKQSHYSISLVTIEILILGKYSSVCTATDYEKGSCERIFEMPDFSSAHYFDVQSVNFYFLRIIRKP